METEIKTLKTRIHYYYFHADRPNEAQEYREMCERLQADSGRRFFHVIAHPGSDKRTSEQVGSKEITLELAHVFADQWNSTDARVFDWYEGIYPNRKIHKGYWLEITDEMRAIRQATLTCGYCGKQVQDNESHGTFCDRCLHLPYLIETELHLLRLLPAGLFMPHREELTETERADLLPRYVKRQTEGNDSRAVKAKQKARQDVEAKYQRESKAVEEEYQGFLWLLDHNVNLENCIFYSHTRKFSFGWRTPVSQAVKSVLLDVLVEFPYEYEIESAEGVQS
jgi:hypothetical protein